MHVPKSYRSMEDFEREELGRDSQAGFTLDVDDSVQNVAA